MLKVEILPGTYYDSVVLMQLQRRLTDLPGILEAGVVMGTPANKDVLAQSGLLNAEVQAAGADDLVIVVRGEDAQHVDAGMIQIDTLLNRRHRAATTTETGVDYRPKSLESATKAIPQAQWVSISVPGRYAADVAKEAITLGKNVFLYSDNVSIEDERLLKQCAVAQGLLVMGPDCGTAIVNGVGLGFANRVRRGAIGVIGASGTGLQQVTSRIHQLGQGITHALGTGGRDLSEVINALTTYQALDLLNRDNETSVIVLISKPPSVQVVNRLLHTLRSIEKPVIVNFIGYSPHLDNGHQNGNIYFTRTLDATAALAIQIASDIQIGDDKIDTEPTDKCINHLPFCASQKYLRGLFSGGTLAYEILSILEEFLPAVYSNAPLNEQFRLEKATQSQEHTIVDLGEDEFTVGRLHPMMNNDLRIKRLLQEAEDPETAVILLDIVLGYGAHPDPASELVPAIVKAQEIARAYNRHLTFVAIVVGTDEDPQDMANQIAQLEAIGVHVETNNESAARYVGRLVQPLDIRTDFTPIALSALKNPLAVINVGLESFMTSLMEQEAEVVQVDWRPPAGGNERLAGILARMKAKS